MHTGSYDYFHVKNIFSDVIALDPITSKGDYAHYQSLVN